MNCRPVQNYVAVKGVITKSPQDTFGPYFWGLHAGLTVLCIAIGQKLDCKLDSRLVCILSLAVLQC